MNKIIRKRLLKQYIIYEAMELFSIPEMTLDNENCFIDQTKTPQEVIVTLSCPVQFYYQCTGSGDCGGGERFEFIEVRFQRYILPQPVGMSISYRSWLMKKIFIDPGIENEDGDDIIYVLDYAQLFHYYMVGKRWIKCRGRGFSTTGGLLKF
jgi:hypothetical protein